MNKSEQLKVMPIGKLIKELSAPTILSFVISTINVAIDRMFIGRVIGTAALAAVTVALGIQTFIQAVSQIIASGGSSVIALELGKNHRERVDYIIGNAFFLLLIVSFIITVLGCTFIKPVLILFGAGEECIKYAIPYTFIMIASTVVFMISQVMNNIIRGMGYAKRAMCNFMASMITNLCLDALFIVVFHMGVIGAALATTVGYIFSSVLSVKFLISKESIGNLKVSNIKMNSEISKNILCIGLPALIMQAALSFITLIYNHIADMYGGSTGQACYGIISTLLMIIYMPVMGVCIGIQPIVGVNYGAGLYKRVKETVITSLKYTTIFCAVMSVIIELFSREIARIFVDENSKQFIDLTSNGLRIIGISIALTGIIFVGANYFQYVGKAKQSIFLTSLKQVILIIPLVTILPMFLGIDGMFIASPISDFISCAVITVLFIKEFRNLSVNNESISYN